MRDDSVTLCKVYKLTPGLSLVAVTVNVPREEGVAVQRLAQVRGHVGER